MTKLSDLNPYQRPINYVPTNNPKHEAFAQCMARGMTQKEAYVGAGYSPNGAAQGAGALLRLNPWIKDRVAEIQRGERTALERARPDLVMLPTYAALGALQIDKERILRELWDNAMKGKGSVPYEFPNPDDPTATVKQYKIDLAVSNAALIAIGKEMGMFVDGGKNTPDEKEIIDVSAFSDEKLEKLEKLLDTSINDA